MNHQEKEIYFKHMERRHKQEAEKIKEQKETLKHYRQKLIEDALKHRPDLDPEKIKKFSIRVLELL